MVQCFYIFFYLVNVYLIHLDERLMIVIRIRFFVEKDAETAALSTASTHSE